MSGLNGNHEVDKNLQDVADSFWGYFVKNRRMAIMVGLIFVVAGTYSFTKIPRESNPEVKVPYGVVITAYPGASPQEVSSQVTFKIEQKIKSLEDLKTMTSSSSEGVSTINVEFEADADLDTSIRKLKDKVDEAKATLPDDAEDPFVQELSFSSTPIISYSFFGNLPYAQLLDIVQDVQNEFEQNGGVQSAGIAGERQKHILVSVREDDMVQFGLSLRAIGQAIRAYHSNSPVGNIEIDDLNYRVRISADQDDAVRVGDIPVSNRNGAIIYIKDLADVSEEFEEATTASRVSINGETSFPAISISIVKKTGANIIKTVDELDEVLENLKISGIVPAEVEVLKVLDMADYTRKEFNRLMTNALATVVLIFFILLLALGVKEALIGGIAIPFTFLVSFVFLYQTGNTFNFLVMFSLILGLGLLVDATIVMMEGIHEYLYTEKLSPINAAMKAVKTYRYSLLSGMLTTIAAFIPMFMMSGIMGQFFKFIPTTVNTVLISSFIIGLFIIPAYAVMLMNKPRAHVKEIPFFKRTRIWRENWIKSVNVRYIKLMKGLVEKKRNRVLMLWITLGAFVSALLLPVVGLVKIEGFPLVDNDFMMINVEAPVGVTLDKLDPIVRQVEAIVQKDENVASYVVNLGTGGSDSLEGELGGGSTSSHLASFTLNFVPIDDRTEKSFIIAGNYSKKLQDIAGAKITVPELRSGPPQGSAIQVLVFGDDFSQLQSIASDIKKNLATFGGAQVDDDIATSTAEFTFDFSSPYSKAVLNNQGLSVADVSSEVRMAVFPTKVASIKRGDEEIDIDVQAAWPDYKPSSIDAVKQIQIQNARGDYVDLGQLTEPRVGASLTSIHHYDGHQAITVSADVQEGLVPAEVLSKLIPYLDAYDWPEGYHYELAGGNEDTIQSFKDLLNAMIIGILLIFLILVTQFNSFKQPFVILMALPLSLIGVLYGFMFFQLKIGVATMIGIVALAGIVVNDAIVLIDRINFNRRESGMKLEEAIMEAGPARLQPIIITSITTVLGILPISLTDAFWLTLGMAIVFGMLFSTVLTLIIIPVFYYSMELNAELKARKHKK